MIIKMDEIKHIKDQLASLGTGQQRILGYLESDQKTNTKGLVEVTADNQKRLDKLERDKDIRKAVNASYGFLGAAVFGFFYFVIKLFITKKIGL